MGYQINKLIRLIDELIMWTRDNQGSPIPSNEKKRLQALYSHLLSKSEITDEQWEEMKPKHGVNHDEIDFKYWRDIKLTLSELKKNTATVISNAKESIRSKNNRLPLPFANPVSREKKAIDDTIIINGRKMKICPNCNASVLPKNIERHKSKCKPNNKSKKNKKVKQLNKQTNNKTNGPSSGVISDYRIERNLDGSYGYHNFRRENGRFGSHSSFDNMGDESIP